jgi:hypothetical protein
VAGPEALAQLIIDQLTDQTVDCLVEAAFAEDGHDWQDEKPGTLARHVLTQAGLAGHDGIIRLRASLGVPVIGLGASAPSYYGAVGNRLGARMVLPEHAGVANAIGAVVGQVAMHAEGIVTSPGPGIFTAHLTTGPARFPNRDSALKALEEALSRDATVRARLVGVQEMRLTTDREMSEIEIEGQLMFIEAKLRVTAYGRPRIAVNL